ncbi:MAG: purine-nucleoside phosphorylase [Thermodesulfobacteriota bacterium]
MQETELLQQARQAVADRLQGKPVPEVAVILGTGLGNWTESQEIQLELPFQEIPGLPQPTVDSHAGRLLYLQLGQVPTLLLQGRFHLYEGYTPAQVCQGVRLAALLGVKTLVVSNAAGALNPGFASGGIMVIRDQMNMTGRNPLLGQNIEDWGPRFPDMSAAFDASLQTLALETAADLGLRLEHGVYAGVLGPCLETPAETRALRLLGADAVGMSTVLEVIAARHMGLRVLGLSCLTNKNLPDCMQETSFQEIVDQAQATGRDLGRLLQELIPRLESMDSE